MPRRPRTQLAVEGLLLLLVLGCPLAIGALLHGSRSKHPGSDVDLLVEFEPGQEPGLLALAEMEAALSALLGRPVDMRTAQDLSRYFRDEVLQTAEVQYAR